MALSSDLPMPEFVWNPDTEILSTARKNADGSVIRLDVGEFGGKDRVQVADKLMVELDRFGDLAGFWLIDVRPG